MKLNKKILTRPLNKVNFWQFPPFSNIFEYIYKIRRKKLTVDDGQFVENKYGCDEGDSCHDIVFVKLKLFR